MKLSRERSAANPQAAFEAAGTGNREMARTKRAPSWKQRKQTSLSLDYTAPVSDPTFGRFFIFFRKKALYT
jgi:hypothetical protein